MDRPARILHCHSTFLLGGKEARAVRLMNAFGDAAEHVVLTAVPGALAARDALDPAIKVDFPGDAAPSLEGLPGIGRYRRLARYMARFDLVLSYNWGAMDAVGARRLFGTRRLPPLVHHEDGFNQDEVERQKPARIWFRRLMLGAAHRIVVPSRRLERIACGDWWQPIDRVVRIANGIGLPSHSQLAAPSPIEGCPPGRGLVIGTVAGLRPVKNLARMVRMFAAGAPGDARLVILGDGPDKPTILDEAERLSVADRVILPGFVRDPVRYLAGFDIFLLSSDSEQFPISLIEAMACGLPAITTDVGDIADMLAAENRPYVIPAGDEAGLAAALRVLAGNAGLRRTIGAANRRTALERYDEQAMIERYRSLYWDTMRLGPGA
ncbi:glycosyltransferase [Rhizorhabdus sp.]|uniref:glycosyltransferase n=1 Tax=Rhizorhabdus sp. TaxID=1968843 RepID=UPI0025DAB2F7|nr:glycosyltransferase [Rhizorhabdus sp.]